MNRKLLAALILMAAAACTPTYDILIVGGGASGAVAGIEASRLGLNVAIAEPTQWLGGELTSAGVSAIDGNYRLRSGIFGEFVDSLAARYGGLDALKTGWVSNVLFEPHVGAEVLRNMMPDGTTVWFGTTLETVAKDSRGWKVRLCDNGRSRTVRAKLLLDGTELGDLAKACGVEYELGYLGGGVVQDMTMVLTVKDFGCDQSIPMPEGYDPMNYANCCVNPLNHPSDKTAPIWSPGMMLSYGRLPGGRIMLNWPLDGNNFYAEMADATPAQRDSLVELAKNHTLGYLYFIQHELGYRNIGICYDEYPTEDGFPMIPYHRESRRIKGIVRLNETDLADPYSSTLYQQGVAVGDYPIDHHHYQYEHWKDLPRDFPRIPSFTVPLGVMIPADVDDLIVADKSISVSWVVNGTTRLQPVLMGLGQAAGVLAYLSIEKGVSPREVPVREVQMILLQRGARIQPYLNSNPSDPDFIETQLAGTDGIIPAQGRNVDWSNEMWLLK